MHTHSVWRAWNTDAKWNPSSPAQVSRLIELTVSSTLTLGTLLGQHLAAIGRCVSRYSTPAAGGSPPALHLALSGHPARQLAVTCTLAVDPQGVDTNTWRPALVSRTVG